MKKILFIVPVLISLLFLGINTAAAEPPVQLTIGNEKIKLPYPVMVEKGTTLIPLRFFAEKLDTKIDYLPDTDTVYLKKGAQQVQINASSSTAYINGKGYSLNGQVKKINNRVYVPLRFLAQALGVDIAWDEHNRKITIQLPEQEEDLQQNSQVVWQKELEQPVSARPLVTSDGTIYIPNGHTLTALSKNGTELWSLQLGKQNSTDLKDQQLGTPVVNGENLFLATKDYLEANTNFTRTLYSVSKKGKLNWSLDHYSSYKGETADVENTPAFSNKHNHIYFREKEGMLAYFPDPILHWRYSSDKELPVNPIVINRNDQVEDIVLIDRAEQGKIVILNEDNQEEWSYPVQLGRVTNMVYDGESRRLFVALTNTSSKGDAGVLCLDLLTKTFEYQSYFTEPNIIKMQPHKGELFVTTGKGLYKLDRKGNAKKYLSDYEDIIDFYEDNNGNLWTLHKQGVRMFNDGKLVWEMSIKDAHTLMLTSWNEILITAGNKVVAIDNSVKK